MQPYREILGDTFARLDAEVQRAHLAPLVAEGTLDVEHGTHWLTPLMIRLLRLPSQGRGQPVRLDVASEGAEVAWTRRIGSRVLRTRQHASGRALVERHGVGCIAFALAVEDKSLVYEQIGMSAAGVTLPPQVCPRVRARVSAAPEGWHVDVEVAWRGHLVCRYAGVVAAR